MNFRVLSAAVLGTAFVLAGCGAAIDSSPGPGGLSVAPPPPPRSYSTCSLPHDELPSYGTIAGADFGAGPEPLTRVPPSYPELARESRVEGVVEMSALVCEHGKVLEIRVEHSIPLLDEAAMAALSQWTFKPAERNGKPIAAWVREPVRFSLH